MPSNIPIRMGGTSSVVDSPVFESFHAQIRQAGAFRPLHLWKLNVPACVSELDLTDLAILFTIDKDGDGVFSCGDIVAFSERVNTEAKVLQDKELARRITGISSLVFFAALRSQNGVNSMRLTRRFCIM